MYLMDAPLPRFLPPQDQRINRRAQHLVRQRLQAASIAHLESPGLVSDRLSVADTERTFDCDHTPTSMAGLGDRLDCQKVRWNDRIRRIRCQLVVERSRSCKESAAY